jgi:hypothetical protein
VFLIFIKILSPALVQEKVYFTKEIIRYPSAKKPPQSFSYYFVLAIIYNFNLAALAVILNL